MNKGKVYFSIFSEGYPNIVSARNNKNELIARSLKPLEFDAYVYSKKFYKNNKFKNKLIGIHNEIFYRFLNNKKIKLFWISNVFKELFWMLKESRKYNNKVLVLSYSIFPLFLLNYIFAKLLNFKVSVSIMEWHIDVAQGKNWLLKLNAFLFDFVALRLVKKVIPISKFIEQKLIKFKSQKDIFLLPVLTDVKYIDNISKENTSGNKYFLYCGNTGYFEVIQFVTDSYKLFVKNTEMHDVGLHLVLHGDNKKIQSFIDSCKEDTLLQNLQVFNSLSYKELIKKYKSAYALLIPLRETIQDKARFPHKIAEYLASGRPLITNKWGEVDNYLENKKNALIAHNYDKYEYADVLEYAICNEEQCNEIGNSGKELCNKFFDYRLYGNDLSKFLLN